MTPPAARRLRVGGRSYPVLLPSRFDPRLHLALVIVTLQVLGQTVLGFELSAAQILLSVGTCAVLEVAIAFALQRVVLWPSSALLTGNGVAFIMRTAGTVHGDWWSLAGWHIFVVAAGLSLLSKYAIRVRGVHVFNPSNFGLVVGFVLFGTSQVNPLDLWWGPWSGGLAAAVAVIVAGGLLIARRMRMLGMTVAFFACLALGVAVIAMSGHCMTARWHYGAVCGSSYFSALTASPEVLVFMFFMITDPRTTPDGRVARVGFGAGVALVATLLMATQSTEFGTKVGILGGLAVVCAARGVWLAVCGRVGLGVPRALRFRLAGVVVLFAAWIAALPLAAVAGGMHVAGGPGAVAVAAAPDAIAAAGALNPMGTAVALPPITVSDAAMRADPTLTSATTAAMVRDLTDDLSITADALRRLDTVRLATASHGAWLAAQRRALDAARRSARIDILTWQPAAATVVLIHDPANPQSSPLLGLDLRGAVHRERCDTATGAVILDEGTTAWRRLFVLDRSGGVFLISAEYPAP
ncbi:MAG TPA: hypothetical protein VN193_15365 [Candidatus Angelobacter sp.]|nr:hypothetical protein [Candidatus Angelobacter sp.]